MSTFLFRVQETFTFNRLGVVILSEPGVDFEGIKIKLGDSIELRRPDGTALRTRVAGIEIACPNPGRHQSFLLPKDVHAEEVPPGTEVWQV